MDDDQAQLKADFQRAVHAVFNKGKNAQELSEQADGKGDRARAYYKAWAELLKLYAQPKNFLRGSALNIMPPMLALQLADMCDYLGRGKIPEPVADCAAPGNLVGPDEERDIRRAVAYVLAAKNGLIDDASPVKTVTTLFGCKDRKSVQGWVLKYQAEIGSADKKTASEIEAQMRAAGKNYSLAGRSQNSISRRSDKNRRD